MGRAAGPVTVTRIGQSRRDALAMPGPAGS